MLIFIKAQRIQLLSYVLTEAIVRIGCASYGCCWGIETNNTINIQYSDPNSKILRRNHKLCNVKLIPVQIYELINYLTLTRKAHPISGINMVLDKNYNLLDVKINGKKIDENKIYSVATSDYLLNGGDKMTFFSKSKKNTTLDYKIRNVLIDYFKEVDTVNFKIDNRFIIKN